MAAIKEIGLFNNKVQEYNESTVLPDYLNFLLKDIVIDF